MSEFQNIGGIYYKIERLDTPCPGAQDGKWDKEHIWADIWKDAQKTWSEFQIIAGGSYTIERARTQCPGIQDVSPEKGN